MKYNLFTFQNNKLLCWRLGNMNSNKQTHASPNLPPVKRGVWCFPYPHYDLFFCYHQWESHLPKKYRNIIDTERDNSITDNMTLEEASAHYEEHERLIKLAKKKYRPTTFWWGGKFYSHIDWEGHIGGWYLWENPKDWARVARKTLISYYRVNEERLEKINYAKDHLEIFIPNYK